MPFLHLPVQSGSDRVLKAMNRRHGAEDYLRLVERIRAARPDIALSGDFIVGFPGRPRRTSQATLALVEAVGYAQAYSFAYSARPGTPAAERAEVGRGGEGRAAAAAAGAAHAAAGGVPGRAWSGGCCRCWSRRPGASPGRSPAIALPQRGASARRAGAGRADRAGADHGVLAQFAGGRGGLTGTIRRRWRSCTDSRRPGRLRPRSG